MNQTSSSLSFKLKRDMETWTFPKEGTIYTYTIVNFPLVGYTNPPYHIGIIELDREILRVTARLEVQNNQEIFIGQKVLVDKKTFPESKETPILVAKLLN